MKRVSCATLDGFDAKIVDVEVAFVRALPSFAIVGLAQTSIQESKERIKSALSAIDFKFPPQKVTVNLSPSDLKKEGSHFDLPIALLIALQKEEIDFDNFLVLGELGLDGTLKDTHTIFPLVLSLARDQQIKKVLIPETSYEKVSKIPHLEIFCANNLEEAINLFKDPQNRSKLPLQTQIDAKKIVLDKPYYYLETYPEDFYDIKGQERAKRASLIAAAGMHNILYEGSPGCGKSMCAKRLPAILPPMSLDEILTDAKLLALEGKEADFLPIHLSRSPHRSATLASILGGGSKSAKIGEVALCGNNGVLFFDELPYFSKGVLEALREPLEENRVLISRVNTKIDYPAKFLFVGAMNPCPCGNLLSLHRECRCSDLEIRRYKNRLSDPLLDRIDLYVQMEESDPDDESSITSQEMHHQVIIAFQMQKERAQTDFNGKLNDQEIVKFCTLDNESQTLLDEASRRYHLSQRAINKIIKVARTIADLEKSHLIGKRHLLEALSFRTKNQK